MKAIFDAIRTHFAHKPREYRDSHRQLRSLAQLERGIRGFSNRLETLTGLKPLAGDDIALQRNLRDALGAAIWHLNNDLCTFAEAERAGCADTDYSPLPALTGILALKDDTGYLCSTALGLLQHQAWLPSSQHQDGTHSMRGKARNLHYTPGMLSFTIEIQFSSRAGKTHEYLAGPFHLQGADLDSLGGAAKALQQLDGQLKAKLRAASESPPYKEALAEELRDDQAKKERFQRIRGAFRTLPPADREHLLSLTRHTLAAEFFS